MFKHRLLLGWINDNSPTPLTGKPWPIIDIDDRTVRTYREFLQRAHSLNFTAVTIWGLFVSDAWPVPLVDSAFDERRRIVDQIMRIADETGIKVIHGFGAYGWGFQEIIRHDPTCARNEGRKVWGSVVEDNGLVMCYHEPSARDWMRKVIDLTVQDFGATGISLQAGDLGRCYCHQCRQMGDLEYYSRIVDETAMYARSLQPDILLGHSCWGVELDGPEEDLVRLGSHLDFLTDVTDQLAKRDRKSLAAKLNCTIGSLGGAVIVPPQRWERNRWFLPHARYSFDALRKLKDDGANAFEFFFGPLNNPQFGLMTHFVGRALESKSLNVEEVLSQSIEALYMAKSRSALNELVQICLEIEAAYLKARGHWPNGEFDFEPLRGEEPGRPIYLEAIPIDRRAAFCNQLETANRRVFGIYRSFHQEQDVLKIAECLTHMVQDLKSLI